MSYILHFVFAVLSIEKNRSMYHSQKKTLKKGQVCKYTLYDEGDEELSYSDFLELLQKEPAFRSFFIGLLSNIPFHAYQWETPPLGSSSVTQPFQFVVSRNPGIDLPPDPGPFRQYFNSTSGSTAVFNNLGNDAILIAPKPGGEDLNYSHIGAFTEEAPTKQQHALWQVVGRITQEQISDEPLWLNTAGGGVAWLHVRLDSRPKYYRHQPFTVI